MRGFQKCTSPEHEINFYIETLHTDNLAFFSRAYSKSLIHKLLFLLPFCKAKMKPVFLQTIVLYPNFDYN